MKKSLKILFPILILSLVLLTSCIPPIIVQHRVLIDDMHGNGGYNFSLLKSHLEAQGYIVNYSSDDFGFYPVGYGAVIIPNPTSFSSTDLAKLDTYYKQQGGGILFLANRYQNYSVINSMLNTLGSDLVFGFQEAVLFQRDIYDANGHFEIHPTTSGLFSINLVGGCSVTLPFDSDATKVIAVPEGTFTNPQSPVPGFEPQVVQTLYLAGAVDSHWMGGKIFAFGSINSFSDYFYSHDNETLLSNIINWLK